MYKIHIKRKKLTRMRLTKVGQIGVEMLQNVATGYDKTCPIP